MLTLYGSSNASLSQTDRTHLIVSMMKQNLRKLKRFRNVTINKLVNLCPKFIDIRQFFKEHFHDLVPENYGLDEALAK
jgi:hypothetical protein